MPRYNRFIMVKSTQNTRVLIHVPQVRAFWEENGGSVIDMGEGVHIRVWETLDEIHEMLHLADQESSPEASEPT